MNKLQHRSFLYKEHLLRMGLGCMDYDVLFWVGEAHAQFVCSLHMDFLHSQRNRSTVDGD